MRHKKRFSWSLIWYLFGLIFSLSISAMWVSGSWNFDNFFDVGQIYDFMQTERNVGWNGALDEGGDVLVQSDLVRKTLFISNSQCQWNYLLLNIKNADSGTIYWDLSLLSGEQMTGEQQVELQHGLNIISLATSDFDKIDITIKNQSGSIFKITKMRLYEQFPDFNSKMFLVRTVIVYAGFLVIMVIIRKRRRFYNINWYGPIDKLQKFYCCVINTLFPGRFDLSAKIRSRIRKFLFLTMIIFADYTNMTVGYTNSYGAVWIVTLLCLFGMTWVSIDGEVKRLNWNNPVVYGWFFLGCSMLGSEFLVKHLWGYQGILLFFGFGLFYFVVAGMKLSRQIFREIGQVIEFTFWLSTLFCILCRPYHEGYSYMGASYHPAVYASYLILAAVTFLGNIERQIKKEKAGWKLYTSITGIGICFYFINLTQSRTALVAFFVLSVLFLYHICMYKKFLWKKKFVITAVSMFLIGTACFFIGGMMRTLPYLLNTEVFFKNDVYKISVPEPVGSSVTVKAEGIKERVETGMETMWDILDSAGSGRLTFWREYIREFNLWGHYDRPLVRAKKENPHNGFIAIGYRYGIFAIIPYGLMLGGCIYNGYKRAKKEKDFYLFGYFIVILCTCLTDNAEMPLHWVQWFVLYTTLGCSFPTEAKGYMLKEKQNEKKQKEIFQNK